MSLRNVLIVFRKELRDMLRDKRTIRSMVVIPTIAFPLLFLVIGWAAGKLDGEAGREPSAVMVQGGDDSPELLEALRNFPAIKVLPYQSDAKREVSDRTIRALVAIPSGFDASARSGQAGNILIDYYEADTQSELTKDQLQKFFDDYRARLARAALAARGLPANLLQPFSIEAENVAPPEKVGAAVIGRWIPYMIVIFCFTGAMYPAVDLTAGEKERGTMETILSSPVARTDLALGKFLTVVVTSMVSATLSLVSWGVSFAWAKRGMLSGMSSTMQISIAPSAAAAVVVLLMPLALLFASVLLAVAITAKSSREAQSYVSPLIFLVIAPAIIGTLPGVELDWQTAFVPILNASLVSKEVVSGNYPWAMMAVVFGTTCVYAALGIVVAVRMFNREDVLFRV